MNTISSKCQNCGSELWYNPKEGCLTCKYCTTNYFLPRKSDDAVLVRQYSSAFHPNQLNEALDAYKCGGCGTKFYMSSEESSKKCPNCGNSHSEKIEDNGFCADGILPFKITKAEAAKALSSYLKSHPGFSSAAKKGAKEDNLIGVFIPVWNFSYNVNSSYSANVSELKKDSYGSYYSVMKPIFGEKNKRVPSLDKLACSNENSVVLDLFDENDYNELIPYFPEYTYGYTVNAIDRDIHDFYYQFTEDAEEEAKDKIMKSLLRKHKEISDIDIISQVDDVFFNFAYVPVYVYNSNNHGKKEKVYISGTTGKVIGKPHKSLGGFLKRTFKFLGVLALVALILYYCL